jgi:hypothetical protein
MLQEKYFTIIFKITQYNLAGSLVLRHLSFDHNSTDNKIAKHATNKLYVFTIRDQGD